MKKIGFAGIMVFVVSLVLMNLGPALAAGKLIKLDTCWMPEHELFFAWYAKEKGWDKEEGLDMKLHYFESGMQELEALPAKQWVLGGIGGVPHIMGALRYDAYMIGLGNNESWCNSVFARPDSPVAKVKGAVQGCPEVYGKAQDIKGKTFLVTTVSSAHYAMSSFLKVFGLKDKDVVVKQMDQASIMAAFKSGIGDFACLWAPYSYTAVDNGWVEVGNVDSCGAALPICFIGDKEFCDKNPETVAKFLRIMFRSINKLADEGATDENVKLFQKMYKDWAGMEYGFEQAKKDIEMHPVFRIEEQLRLHDASKGESDAQRWERLIAEFLHANGRLKDSELAKVRGGEWITDRFLKMVEMPIPSYK
jgi:ABC-type nitrate/sulfonate/bicarbonate transport system substrate-binding protein